MKIFAFIALAILILSGCSILTKEAIMREDSTGPKLYFCPRQNCTIALKEVLGTTQNYSYCAFFDIDLKEIIDVLKENGRKADMRIIIDKDNDQGLIKGSSVHFDNSTAYMHNKFCVIDDSIITTGSFNPTFNDAYKNNNNLIIINSRVLAQNYKQEFLELWNYKKGEKTRTTKFFFNGKMIENYFCPEDNCAEKIQYRIMQANKSIYFMLFSFAYKPIITDIIIQKYNGLDIKGILEKTQSSNKETLEFLKFHEINVNYDKNSKMMHHKVIIIDNSTVITGSFNPSTNANKRNDENILIIDDKELAKRYLEEFDYVWNYSPNN
jgi:phosphatidylserine/phosphatidylglycerophosphate/cardiolipin synthase-like enzyme